MKSWVALMVAVAGLWASGSSAVRAASPDCAVQGGQLLSWPAADPVWEMCWLGPGQSVGPRGSGMELRAVHYKGILVAKKIHAPLLFAEYTHGTCYRDWMNDDTPTLASTVTHNQLGTPPNPSRLAITSCSVSTHPTQSFGACAFGQTPQAGEACTTGQNVVIANMGDHVTLVSQYRADWYMYDSRISFHADGDIEPTFGFGNNNGTENGTTHWHHNYWRFDFDIDEAGNNMLAVNDVDQATEFTGVRGTPGSTNWSVRNATSGRGYRLVPGSNDFGVTPNQSGLGYHDVDVMGLRFNAGEIDDLGQPTLDDCEMHEGNVANGQSIANQDVVLWYHAAVRDSTANDWPPGCSGASCIPQDSMVCKTAGPRLEQFGDWGPTGTNHIVTANANMTFTPATLTIAEGDTVTFQNAGGNHNVVATSGPTTFRCANGCDGDGNGGNGNLSTANWSATVAFPTAGELTFFCEAHGSANGSGMAGTITVQGDPPPPAPVPGTIEDGAVERAFGEGGGGTPFNDPTANNSDGPLASAGADIMFKTNWYFRVGGATQETMFAVPDGMTYDASGDRATLFYEGLGGGAFDAELDVTVSEPGANQALQLSNMTITNLGSTPLTIDLFNYTDIDADGSFGGNTATDISAGGNIILEVTNAGDVVQVGGEGATAFQVNEWATDATELPQTLENTDVTNLDNSGLPFGPGDFTSTVQWASQSVPGNGSITVQHGIARNTDLVFGEQPEANLGLTLTSAPDPVAFGADVTFTANVSNAGPEAATGVVFTLTLPSELSYQSSAPAGWTCANASGVVTCNLAASIASGAAAPALTIVAEATGAGTVTADGAVDSGQSDPVPANNAASVDVEITGGPVEDLIFANGFENDEPAECTPLQLLADPSFETTDGDSGPNPSWAGEDSNGDGSPFWTAGSTTLSAAHEGDFVVWGGGWGSASTQNWSQSVTIPSGSPRFLNFWRQIDALPGSTGTLTASIDGTAVSTLDVVANGVDGDWVSVSVDVSAHADGAAHAIEFEYAGTGATDGNVYVDSITLECEAPTANAATPARGIAPNANASKRDLAPAADPSGKRKRK